MSAAVEMMLGGLGASKEKKIKKKINENFSGIHVVALLSTVSSRSQWNLEMLVFVEERKPEYPYKNPQSRDENHQQTQPTYC